MVTFGQFQNLVRIWSFRRQVYIGMVSFRSSSECNYSQTSLIVLLKTTLSVKYHCLIQQYLIILSLQLSEGIQWLAEHCPHTPHLNEETLRGYIDTGLMELFSLPLHEDSKLRRNAGLAEQDPQSVVDLYNAVVRHLGAVASSQNLIDLSWPVAEFARSLRQSGEINSISKGIYFVKIPIMLFKIGKIYK